MADPALWIISELYYPEETSTGYFLTNIAEGLAKHCRVNVLCSQPTYSERGMRAPVQERHNGVSIRRCSGTTLNKDYLPLRLVNLVTITLSVFIAALCRLGRGDKVIVVTNPPLLPVAVSLACCVKGAQGLLLVHDVYPEVLVAAGLAREDGVVTGLLRWAARHLYQSFRAVVVIGRDMKEVVASKLGGGGKRIVVIPNWADVDEIRAKPWAENPLLAELGLSDKFVVQYCGNMGRTHGLDSLLDSVRKLANSDEIHFLLIGSGAKRRWLAESVTREHLRNATVLARRPRSALCDSLNACDVAIITFAPGMAGLSVPSRMYNVMAAGKPIIAVAEPQSELARVVQEEGIGWVVCPGDVNGIVQAVLAATSDAGRLAEMGERARSAAEAKYSLQSVIDAYQALICELEDDAARPS